MQMETPQLPDIQERVRQDTERHIRSTKYGSGTWYGSTPFDLFRSLLVRCFRSHNTCTRWMRDTLVADIADLREKPSINMKHAS